MRLICIFSILVVFSVRCSCQTSGDDQDDAGDNNLPTIGGSPAGSVVVNETYSFTPTASDPDDDTLDFVVKIRLSRLHRIPKGCHSFADGR
jgi:hypothetical protein